MSADTLELRYVPLETLRRWDRNAKLHDLGALVASIERHGFRDPPAFDAALNGGEGGVVEGNGRGEALTLICAEGRPAPRGVVVEGGDWLVPVIFGLDAPSQAAAEAYGVAHNNLTLAGGDFTALDIAGLWEPAGYAALLEDLAQQGEIPVGLDGEDVDALLRELAGAPEPGAGGDEFDATPADGPTRAQSGDLWIIGGVHRLIVGDSTDPATVARLMDGERLRLIVTDPPYGVSYADKNAYLNAISPGNRIQVPIANDHGTIEETAEKLWKPAFATMYDAADRGCSLYCFMPQGGDQMMMMMMMMMSSKWPPRHELIWLKNNHVLGRADYNYKHEPIVYAWKDEGHKFYGGFQTSVLEFDKPQKSDLHPTTKPLELIERLIQNSSQSGELVGDWFLGSGTTLIAAHRTGRRCYGVEIEPRYADVILRRAEAEGLTVERTP
jgi:hypothetical protein